MVLRDIEQPPGGWSVTVPQTGVTFNSATIHGLRHLVTLHLEANGIPVEADFKEWIDNEVCSQNGMGHPYCGDTPPKPVAGVRPDLSMALASRFMRTMLGVARDRAFVSREEAERRIEVCKTCPVASSIGACQGCWSIFRELRRVLADNPLSVGSDREFCGACGCYLPLKAWIPNKTLDTAETERPAYWAGCWRNEGATASEEAAMP
jgi:hypothetical protein